jgi:hypothetical protein
MVAHCCRRLRPLGDAGRGDERRQREQRQGGESLTRPTPPTRSLPASKLFQSWSQPKSSPFHPSFLLVPVLCFDLSRILAGGGCRIFDILESPEVKKPLEAGFLFLPHFAVSTFSLSLCQQFTHFLSIYLPSSCNNSSKQQQRKFKTLRRERSMVGCVRFNFSSCVISGASLPILSQACPIHPRQPPS